MTSPAGAQRWQQAVNTCHEQGQPFVLVTIIGVSGSTPRESSSKMVVTGDVSIDTIGGGQLEFLATQRAREFLSAGVMMQKLEHYPLSSKVGQCCGGAVNILYEVFPVAAQHVVIFGAGHVARAVVLILAECDARVTWVDSRPGQFPESVPANVSTQLLEQPETAVDDLSEFASQASSANTRVLILTHDHALDYRLLHKLLDQTDINHIGLIGSATKARRFQQRLVHDGFDASARARCICPVGDLDVKGKLPMEVAVSICAQLLARPMCEGEPESRPPKRGVSWREIKSALNNST
ncbi:MAG: xanthine dehydrogenase accessory factor [Candidatus Pseudothioglobus sp.]|jgi:xanthine dehydrogenase accessory factor